MITGQNLFKESDVMGHEHNCIAKSPPVGFEEGLRAALRFISYRSRSTKEIQRRLLGRFSLEVTDEVTKWLIANKYLDDRQFAVQWKDYRERLNPKGLNLMKRELRMLGISEEILDNVLSDADEESNAYNAVIRFARRKLQEDMDVQALTRLIYPYLKRRGFESTAIGAAAGRICSELFP